MIHDVSFPMALVDFIPVLLFPGRSRRSKATALAAAPPVFGGTFVFITMMLLGALSLHRAGLRNMQ